MSRRNASLRRTFARTLRVAGMWLLWMQVVATAHGDFATSSFSASRAVEAPPTAPHPSIVRITVQDPDAVSHGSGSLIGVDDKHGYVISNWHVVRDAAGPILVDFPDGFRSGATVIKTDEQWDLALLLIWRPHSAPLPLAPAIPQPGEPLVIAGYGQGPFRAASGQCSEYVSPSEDAPFEMIELTATARHGDSGGPIINQQGELAGVLFGSGNGRTTGTHVGRLRMFLAAAFQPTATDAGLAWAESGATRPSHETPSHETVDPLQQTTSLRVEQPAAEAVTDAAHGELTGESATVQDADDVLDDLDLLGRIPVATEPSWGGQSDYLAATSSSRGSSPLVQLGSFFGAVGLFALLLLLLPR